MPSQQALLSFLEQHRDINSLELADLPASLNSRAELRQLNEGVLQLLPDLTDVNGRTMFIDQLVQQLDSNPSTLNDLLLMGNLQSGPSQDPLLSSAPTSGLYAGLPASAPLGFDVATTPEALSAQIMYTPGGMYPGVSAPPNPTLTDLAAGTVPAQADALGRMASRSPAASVPDAMANGRPIARPRGHSSGYLTPNMMPTPASLYSGLYTPLQVQQQQQQQYQQQQYYMAPGHMGASPQGLQKQRMPVPNAQAVDPSVYQARMQALMAYRAMGLQCNAPEDDDGDDVKLSLDEWLDAEKLTDAELTGTTSRSLPIAAVEEPELEDADASDATRTVVRRSVAVQKSFAKRAVAEGASADEPVSYLRRRSQILAEQQQAPPPQEPSATAGDSDESRKELANIAVQLLVRINSLYLRKTQEHKAEEAGDLDDLERELNAMSLGAEAAAEQTMGDAQSQQMASRLAKLGVSSQSRSVPV
ncbi:hypothetical protein LPJ70_000852 [Coemansia sp. RSA 2708]|nr:hypothetical protein LPJ70_000852 [Coemansia sp. RSA 2708]